MPIRSLEFYSGIGGMHYALKQADSEATVVAAFDINTTANSIYRHNFPETNLKQNNIEAITIKFLDDISADLWTMSPPCQPFTKKGLRRWDEDRRSNSFLALLEKLKVLSSPPTYILIENVVGFEESSVHTMMMDTLNKLYNCQEFILSPTQYGVPNSRPRYYLLAFREKLSQMSSFASMPLSNEPPNSENPVELKSVGQFLESSPCQTAFLDKKTLEMYGKALDVITPLSKRSACFTKSYGTYISGCGSYFCENEDQTDGKHLTQSILEDLDSIKVRKLTPREVANLMTFPESFQQPPEISDKQMYKTLGNSVNIRVVRSLLSYLLGFK